MALNRIAFARRYVWPLQLQSSICGLNCFGAVPLSARHPMMFARREVSLTENR
jgi:hypothetical protein